MPTPEPRPGFVERALARAAAQHAKPAGGSPSRTPAPLRDAVGDLGGRRARRRRRCRAHARPAATRRHDRSPQPPLALTLHEARNVDVLIDSERELKGATIRIAASGSIALDGFDDERQIDWQADLERGSNLLSLPVVARAAGKGRLVAVIEHEGRTRRSGDRPQRGRPASARDHDDHRKQRLVSAAPDGDHARGRRARVAFAAPVLVRRELPPRRNSRRGSVTIST